MRVRRSRITGVASRWTRVFAAFRKAPVWAIDFVLIQPKDPAVAPFYLEATKFPVGVAIKLMEDPASIKAMSTLMGNPTHETADGDADYLKGPRGWIWKFRSNQPIGWAIPAEWWPANHHPVEDTRQYASDLGTVDLPSPSMPLQQVSLPMAALLAGKLQCRLPTRSEWQAALPGADATAPNLRDLAYAKQVKYLAEKQDKGKVNEWLDTGIFTSSDVNAATDRQALIWDHDRKGPANPGKDLYQDGSLLFRPVAPAAAGATVRAF